ncbi:EAL domain-containing protein [Pseudoalteromonas fenneropenaei]|uniref:EAL domain-containing protein n=1 Tax=Pseudoalteromonas fenneropenaei TaxID=1737459 RepID=A0ABV7CMI8_9GAMM
MLFANVPESASKILIVDDSLTNILSLKEILHDCGDIYFSDSAKEALALIPSIVPDLILLDIEMPEMDGWQLCQTLKSMPKFTDIPIIFITGHSDKDYESISLELGGMDFIHKPFNPKICKLRVFNQLKIRHQNKLINRAKEQLQALVRQVPVLITYWSTNWLCLFSNDYSGSWFNVKNTAGLKFPLEEGFPDELASTIKQKAHQDHAQKYTVKTIVQGETRFYQVFQTPVEHEQVLDGFLVTVVDISELKLAKQALYTEKERLRVTLNSIGDAVVATDMSGVVTFMNPIAERMTGWRFKEAIGEKIEKVMPLRDASSKHMLTNPIYLALREQRTVAMALNSELLSLNGQVFAVEDSAAPIRDENGTIIGAIMVFHDVSEAMAMAIKMSHLANHDQLTDLPNRILLQDRLVVACASAKAHQLKASALLIDIDNFKYLNDSLGHQAGDELICLMASRLKSFIPQSYTLARLGGDEFVILMNDINSAEAASTLASTLLEAMHEQFRLNDQYYSVSISIGISVFPDDAPDPEQLMRHADVALYRAKQEGRNRYSFFSDELESALMQRHELENVIRHALKHDGLIVHFQPKFDLVSKRIVGAEALARLKDRTGKLISPASFIPLAEESGLILELGRQMLMKSCVVAKTLELKGLAIPISVNVAAAQFRSDDLDAQINTALAESQLPAQLLELEITETALMLDAELTQTKLEQLKNLGISISIDDFGTGYSSLAYLKKFNVDVMKIDMSFVHDMLLNKNDYEIVKTIISLGQSMGLKLVAEGVENQAQCDALVALACGTGQGYLFSKPLATEEFISFCSKEMC